LSTTWLFFGYIGIFLIAIQIGVSLGSYEEYPVESEGKQGEEFLIAALVKR
jgi:hypothetical protein